MKAFTALLTPDEARKAFARVYVPAALGVERAPLMQALGRVLAEEVRAGTDLPAFDRSTVDGYAVRSVDTARASSGAPAGLALAGEVLMGESVEFAIAAGQAARIPTGGRMPDGADAVVMQEHVVRRDGAVAVERPVKPGENVVRRGDDVRAGDVILRPGRRLRPQDLGLLAGLGWDDVAVHARPRVGIIVTGDELAPPGRALRGSQIYDMNSYTLAGLVMQAGGVPQAYGILPDNLELLNQRARQAHAESDVVVLAGGSSVGDRDVVVEAIRALDRSEIVVHGIAIRPGKPTILALAGGKPVIGLPGNVVSAMIIFDLFVRPVVAGLAGLQASEGPGTAVHARLGRRLVAGEREDHVRVRLVERRGELWAEPLPGGSAIITSMVRADGTVVVPLNTTLDEGTEVEVRLLG